MKNKYIPTAFGLYLNYLVHGMGVILISLNMPHLEQQWQTDTAGVSVVISSLGIGRLSLLLLAGMLSDRFGRKPFVYLGMICYLGFFFGILGSQSIAAAYCFGFLAGMANSFLDSGTYPSLMEAFPSSPSTANILIKAFVSSGQFLLPMIISLLVWADLWFGWSFIIAAAIMLLNSICLFRYPFPAHPGKQKMVKKATLHPKSVRIPGYLVDVVVVDSTQTQLYGGAPVNRFISGDFVLDDSAKMAIPLNQRKLVTRRALFEMRKGAVGNVGVGIADGIGLVAREEGCADDFVLTVETGPIGGITTQGVAFGANVNTRAILDMTSQFDFYHGGSLDVCYLSFADVDQHGNVGVHKFNGKIMGTGGFIDISATSKKIIFCGTLTAGSLKTDVGNGTLTIVQEGKVKKFIPEIPEITFSGKIALERGLDVRYITERAVFTLKADGLHLVDIAPGVDLEKDILAQMDFTPVISPDLKLMDTRLFFDNVMGFVLPDDEQ